MTEKQKEEVYPIMKEVGLERYDIRRDGLGQEYLDVVLKARPYMATGDWKKNVVSALYDMAIAATDAHNRFVKAIS